MKKMYFLLILAGLFMCTAPSYAAIAGASPSEAVSFENDATNVVGAKAAESEFHNLSAKEKRMKRKAWKQEVKQALKAAKDSVTDGETLLLVILAILLPPLAMALYDGISTRFWISLLLTILGYLPGLIYTLVVILSGK